MFHHASRFMRALVILQIWMHGDVCRDPKIKSKLQTYSGKICTSSAWCCKLQWTYFFAAVFQFFTFHFHSDYNIHLCICSSPFWRYCELQQILKSYHWVHKFAKMNAQGCVQVSKSQIEVLHWENMFQLQYRWARNLAKMNARDQISNIKYIVLR